MADKSSIIVESTNHVTGKKQQLTLTNINPQASSGNLATWGQMTAALTKDTYSKTTRIDRTECDTPRPERQTPYYKYRAKSGSSSSWFNVPTNGIINLTTETVYGNQFSIMIQTDIDSANMQILNITDSNTEDPILLNNVSWAGDGNNDTLVRDKWRVIFNKAATATINDAHQVEFDIVFAETAQYAEWKRHITLNITVPEEGGEG